jgi:hypothetical protein
MKIGAGFLLTRLRRVNTTQAPNTICHCCLFRADYEVLDQAQEGAVRQAPRVSSHQSNGGLVLWGV